MRITLSDRTILVNLITHLRRKQVKAFSCGTQIPILLDLSMSGEKFLEITLVRQLPLQSTLE